MASDILIETLKIAVPNAVTLGSLVILYLNNRRTLELSIRRVGIEFFSRDSVAAYAEIVDKLLDFKSNIHMLKSYIDEELKGLRYSSPEATLDNIYDDVQTRLETDGSSRPLIEVIVSCFFKNLIEAETSLRKKMNEKRLFVSRDVWLQLIEFVDKINCHQVWANEANFRRFVQEVPTYEGSTDTLIEIMKDDVLRQVQILPQSGGIGEVVPASIPARRA